MKHAGSVRAARVALCLSLCWVVSRSLTPPRIIYGGWTPILPGHPFYFGPRNAKDYFTGTPFKTQEVPSPPKHHENVYDSPNVGSPRGHKDIYSYYPPQSAYEGPPTKVTHKPAYFEDAHAPKSVGKLPAYRQILLGRDVDTGEKTFLRITPLGSVDASDLEQLRQIDLSDIRLVDPRKYPVLGNLGDVYTGKPRSYSFAPLAHYEDALPLKVTGAAAYETPSNGLYGSSFSSRPLNPIDTKRLRNILLQADRQIADLSRPSLYGVGKKPLSPAAEKFGRQMRAYLGSRRPLYTDEKIAPYVPRNLAYLPLKTTSPKYATLGGGYSDATLKTSPRSVGRHPISYADVALKTSSPALKTSLPGIGYADVGIQALKTSSQDGGYADIGLQTLKALPPGIGYGLQTHYKDPVSPEKEYLYWTASTPESVSKGDESFIFVSRAKGGGEGGKQFFHAYYAPADHSPPPGYVKMAAREFGELFRNADIRYVDNEKGPAP